MSTRKERSGATPQDQNVMTVLFAEMRDDLWEKSMLIIALGVSLILVATGLSVGAWRTDGLTHEVVVGVVGVLIVLGLVVREVRDLVARGRR